MKTIGYAALTADTPLAPFVFDRRALRANDVAIEILYCGVCHSDLHQSRDDWKDWGPTVYPCVPGHEIIGRVVDTGAGVTRHPVGQWVAVGTIIDSCQHCDQCRRDEEQMCREFPTVTYNGHDRISGEITRGGYSKHIVVREEFVLKLPDGLVPSRAAPLLCAGITVYSPLRTWNLGKRFGKIVWGYAPRPFQFHHSLTWPVLLQKDRRHPPDLSGNTCNDMH